MEFGKSCAHLALAAVVVLCLAPARPAAAAPPSARAFVEAIYGRYHGSADRSPGVVLDSDAAIRRYFTPSLAGLIIADDERASRDNEVPALDGDPFVDAQDWDIEAVQVAVTQQAPDRASAAVRFTNFGEAKQVRLKLVRLHAGWRIDDIVFPDAEGTLRGLYGRPR